MNINFYEMAAMVLFGIGLTTLLFQRNIIKKVIGMNIMDTSVFLFLAAKGYIAGRKAPIVPAELAENVNVADYINPIPSGLVLTGIVVSVSLTAFALALCLRLYSHYGTLDTAKLALMAKEEDNGAV